MNEILQKRIEEKSKELAQKYFPNEMNVWARKNLEAQYVESACKEIATFALQNQWISVEEALPDVDGHSYSKPVLVMSDTNELLVATYSKIYDKWNSIGPLSYHRLVVTHWMEIPSLKGGGE
jgi:hypothetical protein